MRAIGSGIAYFALVFTAGFVLGPLRELFLTPAIGPLAATLIEAPVILALSYSAARLIVGRARLNRSQSAVAGVTALACLLAAEVAFSRVLRGWSFADWLEHLNAPEGRLSLLLFTIFAILPSIAARRSPMTTS